MPQTLHLHTLAPFLFAPGQSTAPCGPSHAAQGHAVRPDPPTQLPSFPSSLPFSAPFHSQLPSIPSSLPHLPFPAPFLSQLPSLPSSLPCRAPFLAQLSSFPKLDTRSIVQSQPRGKIKPHTQTLANSSLPLCTWAAKAPRHPGYRLTAPFLFASKQPEHWANPATWRVNTLHACTLYILPDGPLTLHVKTLALCSLQFELNPCDRIKAASEPTARLYPEYIYFPPRPDPSQYTPRPWHIASSHLNLPRAPPQPAPSPRQGSRGEASTAQT